MVLGSGVYSAVGLDGFGVLFGWLMVVSSIMVLVAALAWLSFIATKKRRTRNEQKGRALQDERAARLEAEEALYSMAHDLKAPLVTLDYLIDDIDKSDTGPADTPSRRTVAQTRRVVHDMEGLVTQMLEFARTDHLEKGGNTAVELGVYEAIELLGSRWREKPVQIAVEADEEVSLDVAPEAFRHIMLNLLDNAVKYGPDEDARVRVNWGLEDQAQSGGLVIEVADNGPGVPVEDRERVFGFLIRIPDPDGRELPGTGVGLALVRRLVGRYEGRVEVTESPEGGALFRVVFPAHRVKQARSRDRGCPRNRGIRLGSRRVRLQTP